MAVTKKSKTTGSQRPPAAAVAEGPRSAAPLAPDRKPQALPPLLTEAEAERVSRSHRLRNETAVVLLPDGRTESQRTRDWQMPVDLPAVRVRFMGPTPGRWPGGHTAMADPSLERIPGLAKLLAGEWNPQTPLEDGATWEGIFMMLAPDAILQAAAELVDCEDLRSLGTNPLSAMGGLVSAAVRRSVLRWMLIHHQWDMPVVGQVLGLGGTSNVLRAIKDLGLEKELQLARSQGWIKRGGRRENAGRKINNQT